MDNTVKINQALIIGQVIQGVCLDAIGKDVLILNDGSYGLTLTIESFSHGGMIRGGT